MANDTGFLFIVDTISVAFSFINLANAQCLLYAKHCSSYWQWLSSWSLHSEKTESAAGGGGRLGR